ncbi:MAG: GTP-binding protein [Rhizobiales bacterium]|nr:GTP-binding protein [Hyphomicrobiales bacterium]
MTILGVRAGFTMSTLDLFPSREAGQFGRRLKRPRGTRIPVYVVTGFLGAGKTTLVREFLNTPEGHGTAMVVNEFGTVGIDDALVRASADETVLLGNGCVCCNTRSDLQVALRGLVADRERGAIPHFQRIVIETSGLADPGPILQTFVSDRALGGEFHVEAAITLVDSVSAQETLHWSVEARKQVILADRLVVTKTDLASLPKIELLKDRLTDLNRHAAIETAVNGVIDPRRLFADRNGEGVAEERNTFVAEAAHSDGIGSFVWTETAPIAWDLYVRTMETLTALRGPDLLRVKGFVNVEGCAGPVVVQGVQHLMHPPVELQTWPDADRATRVVFITRNVPEQAVRDLFAAVRALAA